MIIRLKNASLAKKSSVVVKKSKLTESIAHSLKKAGFVGDISKNEKGALEISLLYVGNEGRIHDAERISKPSRRIYQKASDLRSYRSGFGNYFVSTTKGIMTDVEARKNKVGGEVLFKIW